MRREMPEDHKRSRGDAPGKRTEAAREGTEGKPVDWEHQLPAWETAFPLDETTPPGGGDDPPLPDNEQLVLDDVSAEDVVTNNEAGAVPLDTGAFEGAEDAPAELAVRPPP